jgi:uncharacterized protein YndB with AHSA1/START domain
MPTGRYEEIDGAPVVRFERTFPYPVAAVWAAITDPPQLAAWFPTTVEFAELAAGAPIEFRFPHDAYPPLGGELREVDPPRRLQFTWGDDLLTFELESRDDGAGCRMSFSVVLDAAAKAARDAAGWDTCLDWLRGTLAGEPPRRPAHDDVWDLYYEQYRALGLPATAEIPTPPAG